MATNIEIENKILGRMEELNILPKDKLSVIMDIESAIYTLNLDAETLLAASEEEFIGECMGIFNNIQRDEFPAKDFGDYVPKFRITNYAEEQKDLFSLGDEWALAHCISADFGMRGGIVVKFNEKYDMKNLLKKKYPLYKRFYTEGDCIFEENVFNLVTKHTIYDLPTLEDIAKALEKAKEIAIEKGIKNIAMPKIACGIDRQDWLDVSYIVKNTFKDTDINILVCYL